MVLECSLKSNPFTLLRCRNCRSLLQCKLHQLPAGQPLSELAESVKSRRACVRDHYLPQHRAVWYMSLTLSRSRGDGRLRAALHLVNRSQCSRLQTGSLED
jgi:hypothetical protein